MNTPIEWFFLLSEFVISFTNVLRHNVLFDRWVACFDVMAIMDWMHMAWTRCIIGNPSEDG